ncbi:UDP-N-acetylglucosamine 2-epimerase [Amycolatopsis thermoflava]|uniref:UDP-N-acetylglucosamine 2-epimerase (Non-hydrolysing)/GDP/UDP-N,N'-diacetylbacillosamine 2-epimerase (Hydrolysing) n=1 Tax=Amycolatopsis thermoflava TaxID=84480 RepID=A0A3N2GXU9_9PSEU|nr:UDP-N-acetylglucosamine 2-epimerase [Amycolatopsis thermoflava]ROS40715.1 UDP-N-acetylglucosamine 2-epimerase (non-hydrolysing)/GDP/UDP-N,N'-diacetylbacillosamine 2-epimerase (hydrolysing) [Amycolatopsis thermoflava]
MTQLRKVCAFTGSRADYSPMIPILECLDTDPEIDLVLLVSGGHLVPDQGKTVDEVREDGFTIADEIDVVLSGDHPAAMAKSLGLGVIGMSDALRRIRPDVLLVSGDRYEALAVAVAALPQDIVIAHFGGGQLTYGVVDERIRHALTKIAHLHFVLSATDKGRLVRMGEDPAHVHVVGGALLRGHVTGRTLGRAELAQQLGISLGPPVFTITYHPVTSDQLESAKGLAAMLDALDSHPDATLVFTAPNVDRGGQQILLQIRDYVWRNGKRALLVPSLGWRRYQSLLACSAVVIGNSSSGLVDAPAAGVPSVNIGSRQEGRDRAASVLDCPPERAAIAAAITKARAVQRKAPPEPGRPADNDLSRLVAAPVKSADFPDFQKKRFYENDLGGVDK